MSTRRRLSPDVRRAELVGVGAEVFAAQAYDAVAMDDVARRAGISRAMLYRYFPGKPALFAAVYQQAADRLLDQTELEPGLPLVDQVRAGLDVHIDYFEANRLTVLAANRTLAGDPVVSAIISDELDVLRGRLLDASELEGEVREAVSVVVLAWLVQVRVLSVEWLAEPRFGRAALREICAGALVGALAAVPGLHQEV